MTLAHDSLSWLLKALLYLLTAYVMFALFLYFIQDRLIFLPDRNMTATPKDYGLVYEEVYFVTTDGVKLHSWFIPSEKASVTVLFSHGNGGNISHRLDKIKMLNSIGLSVFIYDYRGYGLSEGRPTEQGTYTDALSAWKYLTKTRGIKGYDIILYGESLGSAVSIELATRVSALALISEGGFTSLKELAQQLYPYLPARYLCRYDYDSISKIQVIKMPKLFIHSVDDEIVPIAMAKRLYDSATEPKVFVQIAGGHNDGFYISQKKYTEAIRDFVVRYLNKAN